MSSVTVTLNGNSSVLEADFFPPIILSEKYQYECGLIDFQSFNCIPNIDEENNNIVFENAVVSCYETDVALPNCTDRTDHIKVEIPTGSYEIDDIFNFVKSKLDSAIKFELFVNKNTLKCELFSNLAIDFTQPNSIGPLLGFSSRKLKQNDWHVSDGAIDISRINTIRVECSIITGSYLNNKSVHTLHEFFPSAEIGCKISETPQNVIYLPVTVRTIHTISLRFVDQNSRLINFRGENIVSRLHIRRVQN